MKIQSVKAWKQDLALARPYAIAREVITHVDNVFLEIKLANGIVGIGAANPAPEVVGESPDDTLRHLQGDFVQSLPGKDIRHFRQIIGEAGERFPHLPGTQAALDIALHDAFCQHLGVSVVEFYGQKIKRLLTSVTIGIQPVAETLAEAEEYRSRGFRVLKVKTGLDVEEDVERILKLRERFGNHFAIRVDANQGYDLRQLTRFFKATEAADVELIEQPLPAGNEPELLTLNELCRKKLAADESLHDPAAALRLSATPQPFGIFNIKLMKCGGILGAFEIANVARAAGISLFWGCNDESVASITAAMHAAFACPNTRYLDLDGSLDLAEDVVGGGFRLENGWMSVGDGTGLGLSFL